MQQIVSGYANTVNQIKADPISEYTNKSFDQREPPKKYLQFKRASTAEEFHK
jgi:hypothetical protein